MTESLIVPSLNVPIHVVQNKFDQIILFSSMKKDAGMYSNRDSDLMSRIATVAKRRIWFLES